MFRLLCAGAAAGVTGVDTSAMLQGQVRVLPEQGGAGTCQWTAYPNQFSGGYAAGVDTVFGLEEAQAKCVALGGACGGVTCTGSSCTVRASPTLMQSPQGETTYICSKVVPADMPKDSFRTRRQRRLQSRRAAKGKKKVTWVVEALEPGTTVTSFMGGPDACDNTVSEASKGTCEISKKFDLRDMKWSFKLAKPLDPEAKVSSDTVAKLFFKSVKFNLACNACGKSCQMGSNMKIFAKNINAFDMPACSDNTEYTLDALQGWTAKPPMMGKINIKYDVKRGDGTIIAKGHIKL